MKRYKKPKQGTVTLSHKEVKNIKKEVTDIATGFSTLMFLVAARDELGLSIEQIEAVFLRVERYSEYIEDKILDMKEVAEILEKDTGIKIKWR